MDMAMAKKPSNREYADSAELHQYYLSIINCIPNIMYWLDTNCELKGCNQHFAQWLGLKSTRDFSGKPYKIIKKHTDWSQEQIKSLELDDMTGSSPNVAVKIHHSPLHQIF